MSSFSVLLELSVKPCADSVGTNTVITVLHSPKNAVTLTYYRCTMFPSTKNFALWEDTPGKNTESKLYRNIQLVRSILQPQEIRHFHKGHFYDVYYGESFQQKLHYILMSQIPQNVNTAQKSVRWYVLLSTRHRCTKCLC